MVQVYIKKENLEKPFKIVELIVLKDLPANKEEYKVLRVKGEEKPNNRALLKIIKKAKYNPKFLEETIPIDTLKRTIHYRNAGLF